MRQASETMVDSFLLVSRAAVFTSLTNWAGMWAASLVLPLTLSGWAMTSLVRRAFRSSSPRAWSLSLSRSPVMWSIWFGVFLGLGWPSFSLGQTRLSEYHGPGRYPTWASTSAMRWAVSLELRVMSTAPWSHAQYSLISAAAWDDGAYSGAVCPSSAASG